MYECEVSYLMTTPTILTHKLFLLSRRYENEEKVLEVEIEPGMKDGYQYPFISEGSF